MEHVIASHEGRRGDNLALKWVTVSWLLSALFANRKLNEQRKQ